MVRRFCRSSPRPPRRDLFADVRNIGIHALANRIEIIHNLKGIGMAGRRYLGESMDIGERELRPWVGAESSRS